jgi:hypothetical protein
MKISPSYTSMPHPTDQTNNGHYAKKRKLNKKGSLVGNK